MSDTHGDDGLDAARALLPGAELAPLQQLRSGERAHVHRVRVRRADEPASTVIVKEFRIPGEGWVREAAALSILPAGTSAAVLAAGNTPPVLVLEDLGTGPSLADALLGNDPDAAADAVAGWATALAHLHVGTQSLRARFGAALAEREGDLPVAESRVSVELDDAVRVLDAYCAALGVPLPAGALDELRALAHRLGSDASAALSPADTCPDNNVRVGDTYRLIDFESAQWRHPAWDAAYLCVPWPSCWCSWRMPTDVVERALRAYCAVRTQGDPHFDEPAFGRDVAAATTGWAFTSATWFLDRALGSDPPLNPGKPTPTRRAMIAHRLAVAAAVPELPALAELAARLGAQLRARWGAVPLAYAPAFGGPTDGAGR